MQTGSQGGKRAQARSRTSWGPQTKSRMATSLLLQCCHTKPITSEVVLCVYLSVCLSICMCMRACAYVYKICVEVRDQPPGCLLPLPLKCWHHRHVPPCLNCVVLRTGPGFHVCQLSILPSKYIPIATWQSPCTHCPGKTCLSHRSLTLLHCADKKALSFLGFSLGLCYLEFGSSIYKVLPTEPSPSSGAAI